MHVEDTPFVQPGELILTVFVPLAAAFEVILVVEAAGDGAAAGELLADVFPFHAVAAKLDDLGVFIGRPFRLFLGWGF
jgi:hypothetical protein